MLCAHGRAGARARIRQKIRRPKRGRGGKEKGFGEKEFPPRPSEFFLKVGVGIFPKKGSDFN